MSVSTNEKYLRQADVVPIDKLKDMDITVVGCGAIGRQVALQMAVVGAKRLRLVDFDTVEMHNMGSQGFKEASLGLYKTVVTGKECMEISKDIELCTIQEKIGKIPDEWGTSIVFCCVDSMAGRKKIFNSCKKSSTVKYFVDGRMGGESMRILFVNMDDKDNVKHYGKTLFKDEEGLEEACTRRSTYYCSNIAAGLMVSSLVKELRGDFGYKDINFDLLSSATVLR